MRPASRRKRPALTAEFRECLAALRSRFARTVATTEQEMATLEPQQRGEIGEGAATGFTGDVLAA